VPKVSAINYFFVPEPVRRSFSEGGCLRGKISVAQPARLSRKKSFLPVALSQISCYDKMIKNFSKIPILLSDYLHF